MPENQNFVYNLNGKIEVLILTPLAADQQANLKYCKTDLVIEFSSSEPDMTIIRRSFSKCHIDLYTNNINVKRELTSFSTQEFYHRRDEKTSEKIKRKSDKNRKRQPAQNVKRIMHPHKNPPQAHQKGDEEQPPAGFAVVN